MTSDAEDGFGDAPTNWVVRLKVLVEGHCDFCGDLLAGTQIEVTTLTKTVAMCVECWVEFKEAYPEVKKARVDGQDSN